MVLFLWLILLSTSTFCTLTVEELTDSQRSFDMLETGRNHYQLLRERGKLPQYGNCWKAAVELVHEGCKSLSEESQSDMALALMNCFLETNGHETYNCEHDKKPNLRAICIRSMTDRAFNVYTEFFTQTLNICWFLRGQLWQEMMAENAIKMTENIKNFNHKQDEVLSKQKDSISLQEKLLNFSLAIEKILESSKEQADRVSENILKASLEHGKLLNILSNSVNELQSWMIGQVSWIDTIVFYFVFTVICTLLTSSNRTSGARIPLYLVLVVNAFFERVLSVLMVSFLDLPASNVNETISKYTWLARKIMLVLCLIIYLFSIYRYKDYLAENNIILLKLKTQNDTIAKQLQLLLENENFDGVSASTSLAVRENVQTNGRSSRESVDREVINRIENEFKKYSPIPLKNFNTKVDNIVLKGKYNLRSRQGTPDSHKI